MLVTIPLPDDSYLTALGRAAYASLYFRWSIVGNIASFAPTSGLTVATLSRKTDGKLAAALGSAAKKATTAGETEEAQWLTESCDELRRLTPDRNQFAHSGPATVDGKQRLVRWAMYASGDVESNHIDEVWLEEFVAKVESAQRRQSDRNERRRAQLNP